MVITEQRQSGRRILKTKAQLSVEGCAPAAARTLDISAEGVSVATAAPARPGQQAQIAFQMYFDGQAHHVAATAKVQYCIFSAGEFKIGFQFVNVEMGAMAAIAKYLR